MNTITGLKGLACTLAAVGALSLGALSLGVLAAPAFAADTYDIDVILPTTGGAAFLGRAEQQAMTIEEKVINTAGGVHGRPVRFVFHNDQSSPQVAVQVANQVLAGKPKLILGSSLVGMCNAMAPLMRNGPVMYCLSPGIPPPDGGYVFTSSVSTLDLFRATLTYYQLRGWTRVAVLTSTDASGQDAERGIKEEFARPENKGMDLVASARFNPTDVSADAQIQRMKAADPQAIITWTSGTPLGTVFRAIAGAGWDVPVAISNSNMLYDQMAQYAGFTPKQLYIASAEWLPSSNKADVPPEMQAAQQTMFDAFKADGKRPDNAAALAWDPTMIVVTALGKLAPEATAVQLRDYLAHLQGYVGVIGVYDMEKVPQRGLGLSNVVVTQWDAAAGTWVLVSHPAGAPLS